MRLTERLRIIEDYLAGHDADNFARTVSEAAQALASSQEEIARLRKALEDIRKQDRVTRFRGTEQQFYDDGYFGKIAGRALASKAGAA